MRHLAEDPKAKIASDHQKPDGLMAIAQLQVTAHPLGRTLLVADLAKKTLAQRI
jgi:hypothetical protein